MTTKIKAEQGSFPFFGILTLIFITLKLTNFIAWSWWWVMAPVWIPVALVIVIALLVLALGGE